MRRLIVGLIVLWCVLFLRPAFLSRIVTRVVIVYAGDCVAAFNLVLEDIGALLAGIFLELLRAADLTHTLAGLLALRLRRRQDRAGEWIQLAHIY